MRYLACILLFSRLSYAGGPVLQANPGSIDAGESSLIEWKTDANSAIFLSGFGLVKASSVISVSPTTTTTYWLYDESAGASWASVRVEVHGGKGVDFPADPENFKYPIEFSCSDRSQTRLLASIHSLLQDQMKFAVSEFKQADSFCFLTNLSQRPELIDSDSNLRARQIAYYIRVTPASEIKNSKCIIKALIQYQRRVEATWRLETSDAVYRREIERLRSKLQSKSRP